MTSPEKNGVKTLERLIWFDCHEQCDQPQVTASAHIRHQRRTEKDEDQKKAASQTGTGKVTRQPIYLSDKEPDYSNRAIQEECTDKRHHSTELKAAKLDKRRG